MNATTHFEMLSEDIAALIVKLVNRVDGPTTLLQIEREVSGFAKSDSPAWSFTLPRRDGDGFIWGGMTEAGTAALHKIIYGRKVAIQFVTPLPCLLDGGGCYLEREDWHPLMLLPASAANFSAPKWLARLAPKVLHDCMASAVAQRRVDVSLLTPRPPRFTADHYSVGDPRNRFSALLMRAAVN